METVEDRESARQSLIFDTNWKVGICETLRTIYDLVAVYPDEGLRSSIVEKLVDAMIMSKKMGLRLAYFANKYPSEVEHDGCNLVRQRSSNIKKVRRARRDLYEGSV